MAEEDIPKFILVRGCINCESSKSYREKHGHDYGFDHELMFGCMMTCFKYRVDLSRPFYDPGELVDRKEKTMKELGVNGINNSIKYIKNMKEAFGIFYERIGVSLDDMISELDAMLN